MAVEIWYRFSYPPRYGPDEGWGGDGLDLPTIVAGLICIWGLAKLWERFYWFQILALTLWMLSLPSLFLAIGFFIVTNEGWLSLLLFILAVSLPLYGWYMLGIRPWWQRIQFDIRDKRFFTTPWNGRP